VCVYVYVCGVCERVEGRAEPRAHGSRRGASECAWRKQRAAQGREADSVSAGGGRRAACAGASGVRRETRSVAWAQVRTSAFREPSSVLVRESAPP